MDFGVIVGWVVDKGIGAGVDSADVITFGIYYGYGIRSSVDCFDDFNGGKAVVSLPDVSLE